jgi:hypothetical protein
MHEHFKVCWIYDKQRWWFGLLGFCGAECILLNRKVQYCIRHANTVSPVSYIISAIRHTVTHIHIEIMYKVMERRKCKCGENNPNFWKCSDNHEFLCRYDTHLRKSRTILCVKYVKKCIQCKCKLLDNVILLIHSLKCHKSRQENCNL